jgi:hypothetical protein
MVRINPFCPVYMNSRRAGYSLAQIAAKRSSAHNDEDGQKTHSKKAA